MRIKLNQEKIAERAKELGMSQNRLALKIEISGAALSMYNKGKSQPSAKTLVKLSRELGLPIEEIIIIVDDEEEELAA